MQWNWFECWIVSTSPADLLLVRERIDTSIEIFDPSADALIALFETYAQAQTWLDDQAYVLLEDRCFLSDAV